MRTLIRSTGFVVRCSESTNDNKRVRHRSQQAPKVKHVVLKIHERCSNPLYKDTKECVAYWNAIVKFNEEIDHIHTTMSLNESGETFPLTETFCDVNNAHMDECRVYDV